MADITLGGNPITTVGDLPSSGKAPDFNLTLNDRMMSARSLADYAGKKLVLNIVPSVDTGVCATSARKFNEHAAGLEGTTVLTISKDLPFAMGRFCAAEGIEDVEMLSGFNDTAFGNDYGVLVSPGPFGGLYARAVVVLNADHEIVYSELVPEIGQEPDYDSALSAVREA